MSTHRTAEGDRLYPAYCFRASPTYDAWVKLRIADVQALRSEPSFSSQHIYFHLNHPIRYVCIVGAVVAIDDINPRFTVLTLDDGSGATIEVKIVRLLPDMYDPLESPSNTTISNVNVISQPGVFEVTIDKQIIDIQTIVKAKCTISEFRGLRQLEMKRAWVVRTTSEEVKTWMQVVKFKREILSKPWHISQAGHKKIKAEIRREAKEKAEHEREKAEHKRKVEEHEAKRMQHRRERDARRAKREVQLETLRRKEEVMMNAGALI